MIKLTQILKEYNEKTIVDTITRWGIDPKSNDAGVARQLIQRFDQIKSSLSQKLDILVLSDELKKNNNYLNIDKYSYEDMVRLIASIPENPDKVKKDAINKFIKDEQIDANTARSYVARFMNKKDDLKYAAENGTEDGQFSVEDVKALIPPRLLDRNSYLDPRRWKWHNFEQMLDALFPSQKTVGDETNNASTDADKIYDKDGLEIYKGDSVHKCISYNPVMKSGRKKYGWCVTQPGNTNYNYYRFQDTAPTFYIIFNREKSSEPDHSPFTDVWHAFVIQANKDGNSFVVTNANNNGDRHVDSWDQVKTIVDSETWDKIKDLKSVFKPIALSATERGQKFAQGKNLSLEEFKELSQDEKILYIQGKAEKNAISQNILAILPKYKIPYEGRTTTLANVAIDSGQKYPYGDLKDYPQLAERYAIFRFRHTDYNKDPIPLPYVQYLDEPAKQKYLNTFDDNLSFELIEKYFGEKAAQDYVNKQIKTLNYLPKSAEKYITDPKLKSLYSITSKLFINWKFSDNFNNEDKIETSFDMPIQDVDPKPILYDDWTKLSTSERKTLIDLTEKVNNNSKYLVLLYALPYIIKDNGKSLVLLPTKLGSFYEDWVLVDENNKVVKGGIDGDSTLNSEPINSGYFQDQSNPERVYNISDLKIKSLSENRFQKLAGIDELKVNPPNQYKFNIGQEVYSDTGTSIIKERVIDYYSIPDVWNRQSVYVVGEYANKKEERFYKLLSKAFGREYYVWSAESDLEAAK